MRHYIGVHRRFDLAVSISTCYAACAIDLYFFRPYQISLQNTLIVVIKYIWRREGQIQGCCATLVRESPQPKNRHTEYLPGHFCWARLQPIVLHSLNENCGANCACTLSSHTTWLQSWHYSTGSFSALLPLGGWMYSWYFLKWLLAREGSWKLHATRGVNCGPRAKFGAQVCPSCSFWPTVYLSLTALMETKTKRFWRPSSSPSSFLLFLVKKLNPWTSSHDDDSVQSHKCVNEPSVLK